MNIKNEMTAHLANSQNEMMGDLMNAKFPYN
ncbi:hypothetical protein T08_852 [Trichinella sp. T8]|nr:hypothetical protein T08_852 [Trichinella sp. T8]